MSLDRMKAAIASLIFVSLVLAALAVAMDSFQDSIEDDNPCYWNGVQTHTVWNTTAQRCVNSTATDTALGGPNEAYNVSQEGLLGTSNASSYLSTIGTLVGVAALIAIVVMAFYFGRR